MSFHIKIGNYRFSKNLGTGSFGKVKLAFHEITGSKVAIKILNKKKIKQQGVFEKVKREIKVLRQFNHPHIIKHYEFIDTQTDIYMVLEYASGGELFDLIARREKLDEGEARRFFQQIISSIEYTHAHKISHRDLKPENLLVDENLNIKLIDFGLANSMKDSHALKTACGSPNYAAPELLSGKPYGGIEVDIWSAGVILFAMICGSLPFDDESMSNLFNKIKEGKFYIPNFVSAEAKDLINRMLQINPVKRITMKELKSHPWHMQDLPWYLREIQQITIKQPMTTIDEEIFHKLIQFTPSLDKHSDEIRKQISEKRNNDLCGIYELLSHEKLKQQCFQQQKLMQIEESTKKFRTLKSFIQVKKNQENNKHMMLSEKLKERRKLIYSRISEFNSKLIANNSPQSKGKKSKQSLQSLILTPSTSIGSYYQNSNSNTQSSPSHSQEQNCFYSYGIYFQGNPFNMIKLICEVLQEFNFEWQSITKDFKLKCRTIIDASKLEDDDKLINEFLKKNFLKFYISIFKILVKGQEDLYMIDISLFKGTITIFMDFLDAFIEKVELHANEYFSKFKIVVQTRDNIFPRRKSLFNIDDQQVLMNKYRECLK